MNSAIPSLLLLLWQNESLYETIGTKMSPVRSFAGKLRDFHVNRFAQALVLRTRTRMWKKSLHMCHAVHQASAHSSYSSMKRLGVFLSPPPPPLDGMLVYRRASPQHYFCQYLFIHLRGCGGTVKVKCLDQAHNTMFPASTQTQTA